MTDPKALEAAREIVNEAKYAARPLSAFELRALQVARAVLAGEGPVRSEEEDNSSAAGAGPFGLLPCSFCGDDAYVDGNEETKFFVGCKGCYCNVGEAYDRSAMPELMFMSAEEAAAAWNRRAGKDAAGEKAGITQASDSLARPSPSPAVRDVTLREALEQCAAEWKSPPCTVSEGAVYLYQEFARRAEIARAALSPLSPPESGKP